MSEITSKWEFKIFNVLAEVETVVERQTNFHEDQLVVFFAKLIEVEVFFMCDCFRSFDLTSLTPFTPA